MYDIHGIAIEQAPVWFLNAFGLIWLTWTVSEFYAFIILMKNRGLVRRGTLDRLKQYAYFCVTVMWWCWRIYGQ